jgi:hypothetical protein
MLRARLGPAPVIAAAVFMLVGLLRFPLPYVLAVLAPLSIGLAWTERL